jgi:hypothetical protein
MATASSLASVGGILNAYDSIAASATDSVLVAAVGNKRIRVLTYMINQGDTTASTVTFNSKGSGAGTTIWPAVKYAANGGTNPPYNPKGWFATNRGEALTASTGAGSTTGVAVVYDVVS